MGNFYTNYTLKGPTPQAVAGALKGRRAKVSPAHGGSVVAFDEASDQQDPKRIAKLASRLSKALKCPVLALLNHDDDVLWFQLYEGGKLTDEYDSSPGYFDPSAQPSGPAGGDAARLCAVFGAKDTAAVERVLRKSSYDADGYVFAVMRHADLVQSLGLPLFAVGTAYASFERGEYPRGLAQNDMLDAAGE